MKKLLLIISSIMQIIVNSFVFYVAIENCIKNIYEEIKPSVDRAMVVSATPIFIFITVIVGLITIPLITSSVDTLYNLKKNSLSKEVCSKNIKRNKISSIIIVLFTLFAFFLIDDTSVLLLLTLLILPIVNILLLQKEKNIS